jgi:hypothetical protein
VGLDVTGDAIGLDVTGDAVGLDVTGDAVGTAVGGATGAGPPHASTLQVTCEAQLQLLILESNNKPPPQAVVLP